MISNMEAAVLAAHNNSIVPAKRLHDSHNADQQSESENQPNTTKFRPNSLGILSARMTQGELDLASDMLTRAEVAFVEDYEPDEYSADFWTLIDAQTSLAIARRELENVRILHTLLVPEMLNFASGDCPKSPGTTQAHSKKTL